MDNSKASIDQSFYDWNGTRDGYSPCFIFYINSDYLTLTINQRSPDLMFVSCWISAQK